VWGGEIRQSIDYVIFLSEVAITAFNGAMEVKSLVISVFYYKSGNLILLTPLKVSQRPVGKPVGLGLKLR
jgi:hypothetical protein